MKWKNRLTNYNFWVSMVSAVLLVLQAFDIQFDIAYINEIATAVLGLLVVIGIINDPTKSSTTSTSNTGLLESTNQTNENENEENVNEILCDTNEEIATENISENTSENSGMSTSKENIEGIETIEHANNSTSDNIIPTDEKNAIDFDSNSNNLEVLMNEFNSKMNEIVALINSHTNVVGTHAETNIKTSEDTNEIATETDEVANEIKNETNEASEGKVNIGTNEELNEKTNVTDIGSKVEIQTFQNQAY